MKTTVQICSSMALIFVCVSMFASLGLATDLSPTPTPKTDDDLNLPFEEIIPPTAEFTDAKEQCWSSSLKNRCVVQIFQSFSTGRIKPLDAACCHGIYRITNECWSKMFPSDPSFPPLVKAYCNLHGRGEAPSPPPPSTPIV